MRKLPEKAAFMIRNERIVKDFMGDKYSYAVYNDDGELMEHVTMGDDEASAQVSAGNVTLLTDREYNSKFLW